jgi:hypothetical protein
MLTAGTNTGIFRFSCQAMKLFEEPVATAQSAPNNLFSLDSSRAKGNYMPDPKKELP